MVISNIIVQDSPKLFRKIAMTTRVFEKIAYRIDEASVAIGLSRSKIYELIAAGELRSLKAGGRRLILRDDMMDFFATPEAK